jgi:hypothetical protein
MISTKVKALVCWRDEWEMGNPGGMDLFNRQAAYKCLTRVQAFRL